MKTRRGQSARISRDENGFFIELYANGEWCKACGSHGDYHKTEEQALEYFDRKRDFIHS